MNSLKASWFCPTMGRPNLIEELIMMFQLQTYQNQELVIVDTVEQMPEIKGDKWKIVHIGRLIPSWRSGYSMGTLVNAGLRYCSGDILIRADDDDHYYPWHTEACVKALQEQHWACPYACYDAQYGPITLFQTYRHNLGPKDIAYAGAWSFTRKAFEEIGGYKEDQFREQEVEFRDRLGAKFGNPANTMSEQLPMSSYLYGANHGKVVHYGACTDKQRRDYQLQEWPKVDKVEPRWPVNYLQGLPKGNRVLPRQFG